MITMELDEIEIDHCQACGGIWLDAGELELLLGDRAGTAALLESFEPARVRERGRPCPICRRTMKKVSVGAGSPAVTIDRCSQNHGLWFDKNELTRILAAQSFDAEHKVESMLTKMFGWSLKGERE
jgi:hypothetical protein